MRQIAITHLADIPNTIPSLGQLFTAQWPSWYGPDGPGDAQADLYAAAQRGALPLAMVACSADDQVLGCAILKAKSVGAELGYGPFLAGFVVAPETRRRGVGNALVDAIEVEAAAQLGFAALFGATDSADSILIRPGWRAIDRAPSSRGAMVIYRLAPDFANQNNTT